jgi:hypothetical protein
LRSVSMLCSKERMPLPRASLLFCLGLFMVNKN